MPMRRGRALNVFLVALSLQSGVTVGGYENGSAGSANDALDHPWRVFLGVENSLYVCEYGNVRVMRLRNGSTLGSLVAGSTSKGNNSNQLNDSTPVYVDASSNIYVADDHNFSVMLWRNRSTTGTPIAGTGIKGTTLNTLGDTDGIAVDSSGNIYLAEKGNHRVTKWSLNATVATIVAGQNGVSGNGSDQRNAPGGLYLDDQHSQLHIADTLNRRIQRVALSNGSINATTVAGGNGAGLNNNQLNNPQGVYVSKTTAAIYIVDKQNP